MATAKRTTRKPSKSAEDAPEIRWMDILTLALTTPGSTGNVYSRFHHYSFLNCLLLMSQGATEPCASYKRWKAMGRQVRKGEKGLFVNRPIMVRRKEQDGDGNDVYFKKFKMVKGAFQASQTDGPDLPAVEYPEWDLDRALATLTINRMPWVNVVGNAQGYSRGQSFAVNPVAVYPRKTTLHEVAHIVLGHTAEDQHGEYVQHRGNFEFEAEATAFLVLKELDTITDDEATVSRGYIQGWLAGQKPSDQSILRVFKAVNTILDAGRPAIAEPVEDAA